MGHGGDGAIDAGVAASDGAGLPLDRSKVHVLVCDKDPKTAGHVKNLLQACSYQVTVVKSAGQVMGVLDSCSYEVDLILTEVELPKEKGFKMLKHIVRQEQLRRIPVVMMSARDEMAVVVKCLRLGAVDYLLKPLRTNELLNLWTHMWRRRRMLGLTEKHFVNGKLKVPFDLLVSETSESNNTNSTNLFSDDTGDCNRVIPMQGAKTGPAFRDIESEMSPHQLELSLKPSLDLVAEVAKDHFSRADMIPSPPRKSKLKLGQSSAFLTYVRASNQSSDGLAKLQSDPEASSHTPKLTPNLQSICQGKDDSRLEVRAQDHLGYPMQHNVSGMLSAVPSYPWDSTKPSCRSTNDSSEADCIDNPSTSWNHPQAPSVTSSVQFPCVLGETMSSSLHAPPSLMPPSFQFYHGNPRDEETNIAPGMPFMHAVSSNHGLPAFSYYPLGLHVAAPQLGPFPRWAAMVATPLIERKVCQAERREAAVNKFRLKRKDRCFDKKIRYVSRKRLAERRPRIRGQFVRRENEIDTNENGVLDDYDDEEEDGEDSIDLGAGSPPESNDKEA